MRDIMQGTFELGDEAIHAIAIGMREVARADGAHPSELALIEELEKDIPAGDGEIHLEALDTEAAREAFIKSLVLVAYADGKVTDREREIVNHYASNLGISAVKLEEAWIEVASALLSHFSGVKLYREHVLQLGRDLGLSEAAIAKALA